MGVLGFTPSEIPHNTAMYGEPGFYIDEMPRPTAEYPHRAIMCSPTARMLIRDMTEARRRLAADLPGTMPHLAQAYIDNHQEANHDDQ